MFVWYYYLTLKFYSHGHAIVELGYVTTIEQGRLQTRLRGFHLAHLIEEVACIQGDGGPFAQFLGHVEVGGIVSRYAILIEEVRGIGFNHQFTEVLIQFPVVLPCPHELVQEGYLLFGIAPCGVVLWVDGHIGVLVVYASLLSAVMVPCRLQEVASQSPVGVLGEVLPVSVERGFYAQGEYHAYLGDMRGYGQVGIYLT